MTKDQITKQFTDACVSAICSAMQPERGRITAGEAIRITVSDENTFAGLVKDRLASFQEDQREKDPKTVHPLVTKALSALGEFSFIRATATNQAVSVSANSQGIFEAKVYNALQDEAYEDSTVYAIQHVFHEPVTNSWVAEKPVEEGKGLEGLQAARRNLWVPGSSVSGIYNQEKGEWSEVRTITTGDKLHLGDLVVLRGLARKQLRREGYQQ